MAYQSLYRKYRPQTFADVMGQEHVTRTLQNALASGKVANGYLFTGTRGTAKTTVARLLAKAVNCLNIQTGDNGLPEPCNVCDACTAITNGSSMDVIEMDAASHRGVADIEEVRRAVGFGPMQFRYKVFIIDEAHQLSNDAKDAFLKTLEEPPGNVVFILATTEPQAIPITIRSRCQQFDFKRGSLTDIAARIRFVLERELVGFDEQAVYLVARDAEGSWRDALSLLEQTLAYSPEHLSTQSVEQALGVLDYESLARVTHAMRDKDMTAAFAIVATLMDAGKEARTILRTTALHLRDLLLALVGGANALEGMSPDEVQVRRADAQGLSPHILLKAIELINDAQGELRFNNQHRLLLELTLLKLIALGGADATFAAGVPAAALPIAATVVPQPQIPQTPLARPVPPPPAAVPAETAVSITVAPPQVEPTPMPATETPRSIEPPSQPVEFAVPQPMAATADEATNDFADEPTVGENETFPAPVSVPNADALTLEQIQMIWPQYLRLLEQRSKMAAMTLQGVVPVGVRDGNVVTFLFMNPQRHSQVTESRQRQEFLQKALRDALNREVGIRYVLEGVPANVAASPVAKKAQVENGAFRPAAIAVTPVASVASSTGTAVGDNENRNVATPPPMVAPVRSSATATTISDAAQAAPSGDEPLPSSSSDPLVQEVIRMFGGEVVPDS